MENKTRLIDADALFKAIKADKVAWRFGVPNTLGLLFDHLRIIIKLQPTVDAVEVIRCRECKYFSRDEEYNRAWCNYYTGCIETAVNGYCYHGAKMDGDGNG